MIELALKQVEIYLSVKVGQIFHWKVCDNKRREWKNVEAQSGGGRQLYSTLHCVNEDKKGKEKKGRENKTKKQECEVIKKTKIEQSSL